MGKTHKYQPTTSRQSPELKRKRFAWLDQVLIDPKLPGTAFKVAYCVSDGFNDRDYDGKSFKSYKIIGDEIGRSEATAITMVRRLEARGHLKVEWGQQGSGHVSQYWMILKPQSAKVLEAGKPQSAKVSAAQENLSPLKIKPQSAKIKPQSAKESHRNKPLEGEPHAARATPFVVVEGGGTASEEGAFETLFAAFWSAYPKQAGKAAAKAEFKKSLRKAAAAEIIDGAKHYAIDPVRIRQSQGPDGDRFTKNPNNWLKEERWADRPSGVTIDENGNAVAAPAQQHDGVDDFLASAMEMYPGNRWPQ